MAFSSSEISALRQADLRSASRNVSVEGYEEMIGNLHAAEYYILAAAANGSKKQAEILKGWSQSYVPYLSGELYDSCKIEPEQNPEAGPGEDTRVWAVRKVSFTVRGKTFTANKLTLNWRVSYSAPHAWMLHENPNNYDIVPYPSGAPPGGPRQEKYLQLARDIVAMQYKDFMSGEIGDALKRAAFHVTPRSAKVNAPAVAKTAPSMAPRLVRRK